MNYQKLDAALSAALNDNAMYDELCLEVSVRTLAPPDLAQQQEMRSLGVRGESLQGTIFSAQVSPDDVSELSEKSWVQRLSLARQLKPLNCESTIFRKTSA